MRLLFVTYEFPPKGGSGVQRPLATARYLAEAGWDVTVLTVADPPTSLRDDALLDVVPDTVRIARAWSLEPTRFVQVLRKLRDRVSSASAAPSKASVSRGYTNLPSPVIRAVQGLFIPDEKFWWTPYAVRMGRHLHREAPFDCILTSGPPFSALGVARRLSRVLAVPWVADLRDPIVGGYFFHPLTPVHAAFMRAYERRAVCSAARTIVVTEGMRQEMLQRHPDRAERIVTIWNGFDPDDFSVPLPAASSEFFEIAYVGAFQGSISPDTALAAFAEARARDPEFATRARIALVGPRDLRTDSVVDSSGVAHAVEQTGFIGHADAVERMRRAAVLLLVLGAGTENRLILTGKLPEYLAAGRPVLALVPPDGSAADVVRRSGAGWVLAPDDIEGTAWTMLDAFQRWRRDNLPEPDPAVVASFERPGLVAEIGHVLDDVTTRGGAE